MGGRGLCLHGDNLQVKVYFHQQYSTTNSEFVHVNSNCVTEWYIGMLKKWLNYHLQSMKILIHLLELRPCLACFQKFNVSVWSWDKV